MNIYWQSVIFIISVVFLALFIYFSYKIGKRRGLKKSLYLVTYRCVCVIFAFIIAPYLNEYILNFDLYDVGRAIRYNGLHFYRIIDFIEEVIVHNEVLNDIYNLFPSLKNLLMDFPQVIFIPFTYVLTFFLATLLLLPLYLFLSYKRKRRILYEREYNKSPKVWAGIINVVQSILVVTIILTPINGLTRIYKESSKDLISDESNICMENEFIEKYAFACNIIEGYNSTIFSLIGNNIVSEYAYDSLTKINYQDRNTSLNKEVITLARAGISLNKTGLLNVITIDNFEDVSALHFESLTSEEIDVIILAFEESLYTRDVVYEVYEWSKAYLDWLIKGFANDEFQIEYSYDEIVNEIRIILNTINYILNNAELLDDVNAVYRLIEEFNNRDINTIHFATSRKLFFDIVYNVNFDYVLSLFNLLKESKIYRDVVPKFLEYALSLIDVHAEFNSTKDLNKLVVYTLGLGKVIQGHKYNYDILQLLNDLTATDLAYLSIVMEYIVGEEKLVNLAYELISFGIGEAYLKLEIPVEIIYKIKDWDKEFELAHIVIRIVYKALNTGEIDFDLALYALENYQNTIVFKAAFDMLIEMLPEIFKTWLAGKDYKYLVGEYV